MATRLVVLTGGTGGAKLIQGLAHEIEPADLTIVCNTADDVTLHGLHVSPDLDTIMYTLAGMSDEARGWGIQSDSFTVLEQLSRLGAEIWFKLGDKDLATHITRTRLLREGLTLREVTEYFCHRLGIRANIFPMSNDRVETRIQTPAGEVSFQEYFVKGKWQAKVSGVFYAGIGKSRPAPGILDNIRAANAIIICPSNPVTSIGPILGVSGMREALRAQRRKIIAVSPIIGECAVSGPAHMLMAARGWKTSALGVAEAYADIIEALVIDSADADLKSAIEALDINAVSTSIVMPSLSDKCRLAREVIDLVGK
jgi:LPPG:FO 2-phospho-L-lactate transferase